MLELKLVLSGIIVVGCYITGWFYGENIKKRRDTLRVFLKKLAEAESYMLAGVPVREIYSKLSGQDDVGEMFCRMAESGEQNVLKLWEKEIETVLLSNEDKRILKEFAKGLGNTTTGQQKNNFKIVLTAISGQLDEAEKKYEKEGLICRKLGFCAGLLLSIFLI